MRKLFICTSIAAALGLAGCGGGGGGETIEEIRVETPLANPASRVLFNPTDGDLNIPNNLLFTPGDDGFFDGTLNAPVADPTNLGDPTVAINALDGWSTSHPFVLNVITPASTTLDGSTVAAGVRIYEATLGLSLTDPECFAIPNPIVGCKLGDELTFGVDYFASLADDDTISIVPLKPLKPNASYLLVTTTDLLDSNGNGVKGSTTWELVRQDINTQPLSSASQLGLQEIVNSHVNLLMGAGMEREEISYVSAITTQSIDEALNTHKRVIIGPFAQSVAAQQPDLSQISGLIVANTGLPLPVLEATGLLTNQSIEDAVAAGVAGLPPEAAGLVPLIEAADFSSFTTCNGLLGAASGALEPVFGPVNDFAVGVASGILAQVGSACAANLYGGGIGALYYSGVPTPENPLAPVNTAWEAACDNAIVLANTPPEVLATATPGPNNALCQANGVADLRVNGEKLDPLRHVNKFNSGPQPRGGINGAEVLDAIVTVPNPAVAAAFGVTLEEPDAGWPVAILMHGISRNKESMLSISGTLALAGIATVAIDHPLHGSRGFDLNGDGIDELNATTVSVSHYMNLGSLLSARDNLRQSVADMLSLRLGLHNLTDTTGGAVNLDANSVSIMGLSLGAITGGNFAAVANTSLGGSLAGLDSFFKVDAAALAAPGGGIANFLIESPEFGPLVVGILLREALPEFGALLEETYGPAPHTEDQLAALVAPFRAAITAEQNAEIDATLAEFIFAAQTAIDSGDAINYGASLTDTTPTLMLTVVGDGGTNLPDQVIPNTTSLPLSGQLSLAQVKGLMPIVATTEGSAENPIKGITLFNSGDHESALNPEFGPEVTAEMQRQIASFLASKGTRVEVNDQSVIAQ